MQHLGTLINCLLFRLKLVTMIFARISFDKCYMSLVETEDFNVLTDNKPVKNKHEAYRKLLKCQKMMTLQQENYCIICSIKNITNLFE